MFRYRASVYILLLLIISSFTFSGCNVNEHKTPSSSAATTSSSPATYPEETLQAGYKLFTSNGIQLTLPNNFYEVKGQSRITFYDEYSVILIERESFTEHPSLSDMSLCEYCKALIESRNIDAPVKIIDGLFCWEYEVDIPNDDAWYNYFVVTYKTSTDFWIIEFVSDSREAAQHRNSFIAWAKMVEFTE